MLNLLWDWRQESWKLIWTKMLLIKMIYIKKNIRIKRGWLPLVTLENQIRDDRESENDFKVHFVLFVLGTLLYLTMKLCVKTFLLTSYGRHQSNKEDELGWTCLVLSCA